MSDRVVDTPKIEAKELFSQVIEGESFLFEYFFESYRPPNRISKENYMKELKSEYRKLKREEAKEIVRFR